MFQFTGSFCLSHEHKANIHSVFRSFRSVSSPFCCHSPLQLIIRRRVLGCDIGQVPEDLGTVDGEAGEQDELLPGGTEQAGIVFYGELAEERQLLDPGDLTEEQLVCQATQQSKQLHLSHFVPGMHTSNKDLG